MIPCGSTAAGVPLSGPIYLCLLQKPLQKGYSSEFFPCEGLRLSPWTLSTLKRALWSHSSAQKGPSTLSQRALIPGRQDENFIMQMGMQTVNKIQGFCPLTIFRATLCSDLLLFANRQCPSERAYISLPLTEASPGEVFFRVFSLWGA